MLFAYTTKPSGSIKGRFHLPLKTIINLFKHSSYHMVCFATPKVIECHFCFIVWGLAASALSWQNNSLIRNNAHLRDSLAGTLDGQMTESKITSVITV